MAARRKARRLALEVLFESDIRGLDPLSILPSRLAGSPIAERDFARQLVEGVCANQLELDAMLSERLVEGWAWHRLPAVDRAVLRLAAYELRFRDDIPPGVALSEAVALATELSTDESPGFVNGLLAAIARDTPGRSPVTS